MSYINTFKKPRLTESVIKEVNPFLEEDEDLDEMSVAAGAGGYDVPGAFGNADDGTVEILGYKKVKKPKTNIKESTFMKMASELYIK
jgi:hypothetical protein